MKKRKDSHSDVEFGGESRRLTPIDVQQQQFRRSFRGYDEQEVDDFLDRVTEELSLLLEEKRAAEGEGRAQPVPATPLHDAGHEAEATRAAEDITRTAREQSEAIVQGAQARAAAILRDAEARAEAARPAGSEAPTPAGGGPAGLSTFVSREREFLQRLAQLVQGHAEGVRDMVQAARRSQHDSTRPASPVSAPSPQPEGPAVEPAVEPEGPAAAESPAERGAPVGPETPSGPEVPSMSEYPSAPAPPPEVPRDRAGSEGGPVAEAAAVEPMAQRAAVVLLPEAGGPEESVETADAEPASSIEAATATEPSGPPMRWSAPEPPRLPDLPAPPEFAEPAQRATSAQDAAPAASVRSESPEPTGQPAPVPDRQRGSTEADDVDESEREASLRELFWGED
jgi:cell division initiation protein